MSKKITITLNDYAFYQLVSVSHETNLSKSKIVSEILNRTLSCRVKHNNYFEISRPEKIFLDIVIK